MNKFLYWDVHHYGNLYSVFRIIIVQGSESKQISSCQIESDTLDAQLGQKLSLPESISDFQILQAQIITFVNQNEE